MSKARPVLIFVTAVIAAGLLFELVPQIDLVVSGLFWNPAQGWFWANAQPFRFLYRAVPVLSWIIIGATVILLVLEILFGRRLLGLDRKRLIYILAAGLIGPGLLANTVLKDHWGRARPAQIIDFGGKAHFTPALQPAHECLSNCSFVSGHGAMAFSLITFVFLIGNRRWRRWSLWATLLFGTGVALTRIVQGGHFLSDTVFAAFLVTGTSWLLYQWIVAADGLNGPFTRRSLSLISSAAPRWRERIDRQRFSGLTIANLATCIAVPICYWGIDRPLAIAFHHEDDRLTRWLQWITQFGLGLGWLVASGASAIILYGISRSARFAALQDRARAWAAVAFFIFASVGIAGLVADLIKILVGRPRPKLLFTDQSYGLTGLSWRSDHWSFPSGHVANVASLAMALSLVWPRHWVAYWLLASLVALSRVGLDQHYLGDVIGATWLGGVVTLYIRGIFARAGINLPEAARGIIVPSLRTSWRYRLLGRR